jgi:hypothetical protein
LKNFDKNLIRTKAQEPGRQLPENQFFRARRAYGSRHGTSMEQTFHGCRRGTGANENKAGCVGAVTRRRMRDAALGSARVRSEEQQDAGVLVKNASIQSVYNGNCIFCHNKNNGVEGTVWSH